MKRPFGVVPDASLEEIEHAFRARILTVHPDLSQDPGDAKRRTKSSAELIELLEVLRDPAKRARYDAGLRSSASGPTDGRAPGGAAAAGSPGATRPPDHDGHEGSDEHDTEWSLHAPTLGTAPCDLRQPRPRLSTT